MRKMSTQNVSLNLPLSKAAGHRFHIKPGRPPSLPRPTVPAPQHRAKTNHPALLLSDRKQLNMLRRFSTATRAVLALLGLTLASWSLSVTAFSQTASIRHVGPRYNSNKHNGPSYKPANSRVWMSKDEDERPIDPNPGGLNQWADDNDKTSFNDLGFFDQIREWWSSDEGKEDVKTYTVSLGLALLLRLLIIEPRYIPSLSMFPTFEVGDQLAVEKVTKRIRPFNRNEVVVFNPPQRFREIVGDTSRKAKEALIKRIVAVEGDKVQVMGGKLFVNDVEQVEPFTAEDAEYEFGPVVVPPGEVLVLGDNRNHSLDGHIWGFLPSENVIGRAVFVYWPPWRVGTTGMF